MEKLYNKLHEQGLYTKSFEEFKVQFNNEESVNKLYNNLHSSGQYTKSQDNFKQQFGFQMGKPQGAQNAVVTAAPGEEQADTTKYTTQLENGFKGSPEEDPMEATRKAREYELNNQTWIERTFDRNPLTEFAGDMYRAAAGGFVAGDVSDEALDLLSGFTSEEDIEEWIEAHEASSKYQQSDEMAEFNRIADEEGVWAFVTKAITEKQSLLKVAPEIMIQSVAQMLGSESALATGGTVVGTGTAIGAVGGLGVLSAGTATAGAIASIPTAYAAAGAVLEAGMSFSGYIDEELQERGLKLNKENVKTLLEDDDFVIAARAKAASRGIIIGAVDRMTAGVGAKVGAKLGASTLKNVGAQVVIESAGGGGGEAAAQLLTEGELEVKEVFLETLGEAPGAGVNIAKTTLQAMLPGEYKIEGQTVGKEEINSAIDKFEDTDFAKTNFDIKNNPALKEKVEKRKTELKEKSEAFEAKQTEIQEQVDIDNKADEAKIKELRSTLKEGPKQPAYDKPTVFTTPTSERYGTVNRQDGKGEVALTEEEYNNEVSLFEQQPTETTKEQQANTLDKIKSLKEGIESRNTNLQESAALLESVKKGYVNEKLGKNIDFAKRYAKFFNLKVIDNLTPEELMDKYSLTKEETETVAGFIDDGTGEIVINKLAALNQVDVNVGSHELLHGIMTSVFKNINEATGIDSKVELVNSFLSTLSTADRKKLTDTIEVKDKKGERIYSEDYLQKNPDEYLTQFSDLINNGEIEFNETTFEQLGDYFTPMFRMFGMKKLKFKDGQDVYNFMKEYQKSIKSGKLHKSFIAATGGSVSGINIQLDEIVPTGSVAAVTKEEEEKVETVTKEEEPVKAEVVTPETKQKQKRQRKPATKKVEAKEEPVVSPRRQAATDMRSIAALTKKEFAELFKDKYKTAREVDVNYENYINQRSKKETKRRRSEKVRFSKKGAPIGDQIKSIVPDGTTKDEYDTFNLIEAYQRLVAGSMLHNVIEKQLRNKGGIMEDQVVDGFLEDVKSNLMERSIMRFNPEKNDDFGGFIIKELTSYSIPNIIKEYKKQGKIVSEDVDVPTRSLDESREGSQPMQVASDQVNQEEQLDIKMQEEAKVEEKTFREKLGIIEEDSPTYNSIFHSVTKVFGTALDQVKPDKVGYRIANRTGLRQKLIEQYRSDIEPQISAILGGSVGSKSYKDFLNNNMEVILEKVPLREFVRMEMKSDEKIFAKLVKKNANPTAIREALAKGQYVKESVSLTAGNNIYEPLSVTQEQFNKFFLKNENRKKSLINRISTEIAFDATIVALQDYDLIDKYNEILEIQGKTVVDNTLAEIGKILERDPRSVRWSKYASPSDKKAFASKVAQLTKELTPKDGKKEIRKAFDKVFANHNWDNNYDELLVNYIDKRLKEETKRKNKRRYSVVGRNANLTGQNKRDKRTAIKMNKNGVDALTIKQKTGWEIVASGEINPMTGEATDGKWGYEINPEIDTIINAVETVAYGIEKNAIKSLTSSSSTADLSSFLSLTNPDKDIVKTLGDLLPERYFEYYPTIANIDVRFSEDYVVGEGSTIFYGDPDVYRQGAPRISSIVIGTKGLLNNRKSGIKGLANAVLTEGADDPVIAMTGSLVHELQHVIQLHEDFVSGASAEMFLTDRAEYLRQRIIDLKIEALDAEQLDDKKMLEATIENLTKEFNPLYTKAFEIYKKVAGEVQAESVFERAFLTEEERRNRLMLEDEFFKGEKINRKDQLSRARALQIVDKQNAKDRLEYPNETSRRFSKGTGSPKKPIQPAKETKSLNSFLNQSAVDDNEFVKDKNKDKKAETVNSQVFNKILEITKGVDRSKKFSKTQAAAKAQKKKRRTFFIPPSAEDFVGLLYAFLAPGKIGEEQYKFFKNNLIDPFNVAMNNLAAARQLLNKKYTALKKKHPVVRKKLYDIIPNMDFTYDQAIRVYLYDLAGFEPKGLNEKELKSIIKFVANNPDVKAFADGIKSITGVEGGFKKPGESWVNDTLASELYEISQKVNRKQFLENTNWKKNKDEIFSEQNLNKIEAEYGSGFRSAMEDMLYRMETGSNRSFGKNKLLNQFNNWINSSVATVMFLNTRSAVLQTISAINYINWSDNNMLAAAKSFANQKQFWSDFTFLFNSDYLKERRSGLQSDINLAELQNAIAGKSNKAKAAVSWLLQKGFTPTQIADSFAIAIGGSTFYRNRLKSYENAGLSLKEAQEKAFTDFQALTETAQQSSRPDKVSQQQAGPLGRLILAFSNTPAQYAREMKKASLDLINGRGDWKTNISKIVYYGAVQNLIFNTLQTALFSALFDDDEEEEKLGIKKERVINGMIDSILRGTGVAGAIVATTKNLILEFMEQNEKDYNFDSGSVVVEALNLSPPIGSKARKLKNALDTWKYNRKYMEEYGFDINNPALNAASNLVSAATNVPIDRVIRKIQNVQGALDNENRTWERVALILGWSKWDVGIEDEKLEQVKAQVKAQAKADKQNKKRDDEPVGRRKATERKATERKATKR